MTFQPLPIGIDDFEKIITDNYYYVDKTLLIKELLDKKVKLPYSCVHAALAKHLTRACSGIFSRIPEIRN